MTMGIQGLFMWMPPYVKSHHHREKSHDVHRKLKSKLELEAAIIIAVTWLVSNLATGLIYPVQSPII